MPNPGTDRGRWWKTPVTFLREYERRRGVTITLDAAASDADHVCENYITEAQDGLTTPWKTNGAVWCYCQQQIYRDGIRTTVTQEWLRKAIHEVSIGNCTHAAGFIRTGLHSQYLRRFQRDITFTCLPQVVHSISQLLLWEVTPASIGAGHWGLDILYTGYEDFPRLLGAASSTQRTM